MIRSYLYSNSSYLVDVCIRPSLPTGITLARDSEGYMVLSGTPSETLPATIFNIIAKGENGYLGAATFSFSIAPSCGSSSSTSSNRRVQSRGHHAAKSSEEEEMDFEEIEYEESIPAYEEGLHESEIESLYEEVVMELEEEEVESSHESEKGKSKGNHNKNHSNNKHSNVDEEEEDGEDEECVFGHQKCDGSSAYRTCVQTLDGSTKWGVKQYCSDETGCSQFRRHYILCD